MAERERERERHEQIAVRDRRYPPAPTSRFSSRVYAKKDGLKGERDNTQTRTIGIRISGRSTLRGGGVISSNKDVDIRISKRSIYFVRSF